jgi:hypothetical protein
VARDKESIMTATDLDSEFWSGDGRYRWEVYAPGTAIVLAAGRSRFRIVAVLGLRRALRRIRRHAEGDIAFLPVVRL